LTKTKLPALLRSRLLDLRRSSFTFNLFIAADVLNQHLLFNGINVQTR
jgi:hypothetical protein